MTKTVNIYTNTPMHITQPPIYGVVYNTQLNLDQIKYCLIRGARIEEILSNGDTVQLTLNTYDKINEVIEEDVVTDIEENDDEEDDIVEEYEDENDIEENNDEEDNTVEEVVEVDDDEDIEDFILEEEEDLYLGN